MDGSQKALLSRSNEAINDLYPEGKNRSAVYNSWWRKYSFFILPVEVVTFLYLFGSYFQMQVYQQYFYQRIFRNVISNWTNVSQLNYSIDDMCLYQDLITNLTSPDSFVSGQEMINTFSMWTSVASLLPSILVSPVIGTLSDQIGRKPAIVLVLIGQLVSSVGCSLIIYFKLNMSYFFVVSVFTGFFGGFGVILSSAFAYVTDITSKRWLTVRMSILEASIFVASAASFSTADIWIQKTSCTFVPQVWMILATVVCGTLCALLIPESLSKEKRIQKVSQFNCGLRKLVRGFQLFFWRSYIGLDLWKVWVVVIVTVLSVINETGTTQITSYFLYNKPLQWNYTKIGIFMAVTSVSHLLALVVISPIFVALKFPDSLISLIGLVFACGMRIYTALLTTNVEMFSVGVVIGMQSIIIPSLRATLARLLKAEDRGSAFSLLAVFQLLGSLIATIVFNRVYTPEDLDNNKDNPRVVYWMAAGIWGAAIPLICVLLMSDIASLVKGKSKYLKRMMNFWTETTNS